MTVTVAPCAASVVPSTRAVVDFPAPPFDETNEMTAMTPPMSAKAMNAGKRINTKLSW